MGTNVDLRAARRHVGDPGACGRVSRTRAWRRCGLGACREGAEAGAAGGQQHCVDRGAPHDAEAGWHAAGMDGAHKRHYAANSMSTSAGAAAAAGDLEESKSQTKRNAVPGPTRPATACVCASSLHVHQQPGAARSGAARSGMARFGHSRACTPLYWQRGARTEPCEGRAHKRAELAGGRWRACQGANRAITVARHGPQRAVAAPCSQHCWPAASSLAPR